MWDHVLIFNISCVVGLFAWMVRDILWVRLVTICHFILYLTFLAIEPSTNPSDIIWTGLYMGVNVFWCVVLIRGRRPLVFTGLEKEVRELVFKALPDRQYRKLFQTATVTTFPQDAQLTKVGAPPETLYLVLEGKVKVYLPGGDRVALGRGQFLGEQGFLTQKNSSASSSPDEGGAKMLVWKNADIEALFAKDEQLKEVLSLILSSDVIGKIQRMSEVETGKGTLLMSKSSLKREQ